MTMGCFFLEESHGLEQLRSRLTLFDDPSLPNRYSTFTPDQNVRGDAR